jgi:hypothetical protein
MPCANRAASKLTASALAGLLAGLACMPAMAQGTGKATLSVGITIVAATPAEQREQAPETSGPRIPVDPAHAIDPVDPLRGARVERLALADGSALQVVSY